MSHDPITFAVIKSALDAIVDEMAYAVIRTARSEIIRDVMDYSAALCDAEGRMVAQAKTIAQHLGAVHGWRATCLLGLVLHHSGKTPRDSTLCASVSSRADGAVCRPPGARPAGQQKAGRERPRCR